MENENKEISNENITNEKVKNQKSSNSKAEEKTTKKNNVKKSDVKKTKPKSTKNIDNEKNEKNEKVENTRSEKEIVTEDERKKIISEEESKEITSEEESKEITSEEENKEITSDEESKEITSEEENKEITSEEENKEIASEEENKTEIKTVDTIKNDENQTFEKKGLSNEINNSGKNGVLSKVLAAIIILILIILLYKFVFNKLNDNDSISGVRKILSAKYTDIECIDSDCNGFIVIDGDKLSNYKVLLYNADGKKIADYKVTYDSSSKTSEIPVELSDDYYISTIVNTSNLSISKYLLKNKKNKTVYETENHLEVINDNFIKMTVDDNYTILDKKGNIVYEDITNFYSYLNGEYINIEISDQYILLDSDGDKILSGYKIDDIITSDDDDTFAIVKNTSEDIYYYFSLDKNKIIGDGFNSYSQSSDDSTLTIVKKENDKNVKYMLYSNGKQEKMENDLEDVASEIEEKINTSTYTLYEDSVYESDQDYVIVDNKDEKSIGILDVEDNKYTNIYSYSNDKSYYYSRISKLSSDEEQYYRISCSEYNCDKEKSVIYDLKNNKVVYQTEDGYSITNYAEYEDGYKVIKYSSSDDAYDGKNVIYDDDDKELLVYDSNIVIIDKDLIVGSQSKYSLSLYSTKENKILDAENVTLITVDDNTLYKYTTDDNIVILNSDGEEIINISNDSYLKLSNNNYVYLDDTKINIYNIDKDKTYTYKLKDNEKINDAQGNIITPYRNAIFINNSTDKYVKVINFKGNKIEKIRNVEISSVNINDTENKAFIIVKKVTDDGDKYGLYVAE